MNTSNDGERFVSILSDYGFKVTFGNESDTRFLRKALQALINSPVPIKEVAFTQNEIQGLTKDSRGGIYDLFCTDELGNHFIIEMQLGVYPAFIQPVRRCGMKFYALYRLNTLIRKGKYKFKNLPKIYCIGILSATVFPDIADYHNIAVLKNSNNELIDDQMTFVTVELAKFRKELNDVKTDLDKLLFTMKTLETAQEPTQFPPFWTEDWLNVAIKELDTRAMTPEQRLIYEMTISANALILENEEQKLELAVEQARLAAKTETITNLLKRGKLTVSEIAEDNQVDIDFVLTIQRSLINKI